MIHPFMVGPMALAGFAWYQGESNLAENEYATEDYAEDFPNLIQAWRDGFQNKDAFFGFVQLSTWCRLKDPFELAEFRELQMSALKLDDKMTQLALASAPGASAPSLLPGPVGSMASYDKLCTCPLAPQGARVRRRIQKQACSGRGSTGPKRHSKPKAQGPPPKKIPATAYLANNEAVQLRCNGD